MSSWPLQQVLQVLYVDTIDRASTDRVPYMRLLNNRGPMPYRQDGTLKVAPGACGVNGG